MTLRGESEPDLLNALAHELRSPLNGLIGFSELLHRGEVGPLSADQHEVVGDILLSARRLLETIDALVHLARLEHNGLPTTQEPIDVDRRLTDFCEQLSPLAAENDISLYAEVGPHVAPIYMDPTTLRHLVYCCVVNAIKRTSRGGTIAIRVGQGTGDRFRLEVADSGPGLGPDQSQGPLGLMLAFVSRLVVAQGGEAGLRSEPDKGNVFFAELPSRPEKHR